MTPFLAKLLNYYHLSEDEYLNLSRPLEEISLKDPLKIEGVKESITRIKKAIENKEKIIIYGDYDCDGISATSILAKTFLKLNYPVSYYIPSRYKDGYGLNIDNVDKINKANFKLIICVDNGISANEAIDKANEYGIDVIVVDHHEVPATPVKAYSIIHPTVSHISDIIGSGGYMALFLSAGLLGYYDDYLVTIAGLSVISDLMELKDYNRDVVRLALANLEKKGYLPLRLLLDSPLITEKSFSLEIAPKINAIGRMKEDNSANVLVKYLISEDREEIYKIRDWIVSINEERKELTKEAVITLPIVKGEKGICLLTNMKEGLIGLIANKLMGDNNVPALVFTSDEANPSLIKGSIRSKEGFNVTKAFESLNKYIVNGGGHALAGGLTIRKDDFESFKVDFLKLCEEHPFVEVKDEVIEISLQDVNLDNYKIYRSLSPFGMGFKEPLFFIKGIPTRNLSFISQGRHLSTQLGMKKKLLGFNMNEGEIKANPFIDIYGSLTLSSFKDIETLEFRISKYKISE